MTACLQIYKFPQSSLAELARNSVIQSGFEMEVKRHWLGQKWYLPGAAGNEINKVGRSLRSLLIAGIHVQLSAQTNVPNLRLEYRRQTLLEELTMIRTKRSVDSQAYVFPIHT